MITINNKLYINKKFTAMDADLNMMREIVVTHALSHAYAICDSHIDNIEFDDVLYISDVHIPNNTLLLESTDFRETGVTMSRSNFPKRVSTMHYAIFNDITDNPALEGLRENVNLLIVGFVNTIPEHIFNNIMEVFGSQPSVIIFGDPLVDSPENNNYFMKYMTNTSIGVSLDYDNYRLSDKKKINNTLLKLRKDISNLGDITNSNYVSLRMANDIVVNDVVDELLQKGASVVLPKVHYAKVNSLVYSYITSRNRLDFEPGDTFLVRYPWLAMANDTVYIIPPMTVVKIMMIHNQIFINSHRCFVCDIVIENDNGNPLLIKSAIIDFTDYIMNYDPTMFPENMEDFEDILKYNLFDTQIHDAHVLKVLFCKTLTPDMAKYYDSDVTTAYIETIDRDVMYPSDFNWYKIFARTKENINIIVADEFDIDG